MARAVPSPSESARFGIAVGRLDYTYVADWEGVDVVADLADREFDLVILRFPAERLEVVRSVHESGRPSLMADTLLHFRRALILDEDAHGVALRAMSTTDMSQLDDLVADVFSGHTNHYHANPMTSDVDLVASYQEWGRSIVDGGRGSAYIVQLPGDDDAGLVVTASTGNHVEVALVGLRARARGAGRYQDVLRSLASSEGHQGRESIGILTQVWNTGALRSLIRVGYEPDYGVSTMHVMR